MLLAVAEPAPADAQSTSSSPNSSRTCSRPSCSRTEAGSRDGQYAGRVLLHGARPGPAGIVTHLHVEAHTLKDLLLALPRSPGRRPGLGAGTTAHRHADPCTARTPGLAHPVDPARTPVPPAEEGGGVDRFALHDGDRFQGQVLDLAQAYDPMTAWSTPANGRGRTPCGSPTTTWACSSRGQPL